METNGTNGFKKHKQSSCHLVAIAMAGANEVMLFATFFVISFVLAAACQVGGREGNEFEQVGHLALHTNAVPEPRNGIRREDGEDVRVLKRQSEGFVGYPLVVSTWPFVEAVRTAWGAIENGYSAVDAVVEGCSTCEELRCDGTVGPGGSPDENGETTIDALIMDGATMEVGAVAAMRYVKDGIRAAQLVMRHTSHTLLVGEMASSFAISMGLPGPTDLSSPDSTKKWSKWKEDSCQPNFWKNVAPAHGCGPYHPLNETSTTTNGFNWTNLLTESCHINRYSHDTISMAVIDERRHIAVGTSTNGATFKIPGRVGDGPIAGSSSYADDEVGACGATGDGDIMMRFLPCYQVVESMRLGMEPQKAAEDAMLRIARRYPDFVGSVFAVNRYGVHAGACYGWTFQYSVRGPSMQDVEVFTVLPIR